MLSTSSRPLTSRLISSLCLQYIHYVTYKSGVRFIVFRLGTLRLCYNEPSGLIQIPAKLNGRSAELSRGHPCLPHTGSLTPGPAHIRRRHRFGTCQNWTWKPDTRARPDREIDYTRRAWFGDQPYVGSPTPIRKAPSSRFGVYFYTQHTLQPLPPQHPPGYHLISIDFCRWSQAPSVMAD